MPNIKIVQRSGEVLFQPDDPLGEPGQPLEVDRGELVSWNNETNDAHWPWPTDAQGKLLKKAEAIALGFYLTDEVPAGNASEIYSVAPRFSPAQQPPAPPPDVPPPTITHVCRRHRKERGSIVVRNP